MVKGENSKNWSDTAQAYLLALHASLSNREYALDHDELVIGRDGARCDIVAAGETISRRHAKVYRCTDGTGRYMIVDLQSLNGVYCNGRKIDGTVELEDGDLIGLGSSDICHLRFQLTSNRHVSWTTTLPTREGWTIGRASDMDISLPFEASVSASHAVLHKHGDHLILRDPDSLNGTWVNGTRIRRQRILPEDAVVIGATLFHFTLCTDGSLEVIRREFGDDIQLECINLSHTVPGQGGSRKTILDQITLTLQPGEFVGIIGPSGAGKSTLLKALNGYIPPSKGSVLLNETSLYHCYEMFRHVIGYVPQDDILHRELTVEDSLDYVARLRLPRDISREERRNIVTSTIEALGLGDFRNQHINQLSGGQRKRVSIGAELLIRPSILFLDEPTSGLDPSVEDKLMRHFRKMAQNGTTILITTHILYSLHMLDRVIILAQGRLVFMGTPNEAMRFFCDTGAVLNEPMQIFDVLQQEPQQAQQRQLPDWTPAENAERYATLFRQSDFYTQNIVEHQSRTARMLSADPDHEGRASALKRRLKWLRPSAFLPLGKVVTLTARHFRLRIGSWKKAALYCLIPLLLALVTLTQQMSGFVDDTRFLEQKASYVNQVSVLPMPAQVQVKQILSPEGEKEKRSLAELIYTMKQQGVQHLPLPMSAMLMCVMTAVFLGTINTCLDISTEKSIYERERMSSLRIADYLGSKLPLSFLVTALQCAIFILLLSFHPDLATVPLLVVFPVMVSIAWSSATMGLLISTLDRTRGQLSVILAVAAILPQLILSGALGPDFYRGFSSAARYVADSMPARWGLEMLFSALYLDPGYQSADWIPSFIRENIGFRFGKQVILQGACMLTLQSCTWLLCCAWLLKHRDNVQR